MSEYEYDTGATRLVISEGLNVRDDKHFVVVSAEHLNDVNVAVAVQDEDTPAVALAILEAAGFSDDLGSDSPPELVSAMRLLGQYKVKVAREAEREAEDAKVREFRESSLSAIASVFNESNIDAKEWAALSKTGRASWHARYEAARKFFEEQS